MSIIRIIRDKLCRALGCCNAEPEQTPTIVGMGLPMALVKVGHEDVAGRVKIKYSDATGDHEGLPPGWMLQVDSDNPAVSDIHLEDPNDPLAIRVEFEGDEIDDGVVDETTLHVRVLDPDGKTKFVGDLPITMASDPTIKEVTIDLPGITS